MYNTCISSNLYLRTEGPFPFQCNKSSSYYCFNDRFDRIPSSSCCCACYACCVNKVAPVVSSSALLYGLRQSALLHFSSPPPTLMAGCGARCYSRAPVLGMYRCDYEVRRVGGGRVISKGLTRHVFPERRSGRWDLDGRVSDAEMMLSLLTEDTDEVDFLFEEMKKKRVSRRVREVKRENVCEECSGRRKKNNMSSGTFKSDAGRQSEKFRTGLTEVNDRQNKRRGDTSAHQNHRFERDGSSSSMQYSISHSDDAESDTEIEVNNVMHVSESSNSYRKDSGSRKNRITGENHRKKKHVGSVLLESDARHQFKSDRMKSKKEGNRKIAKSENIFAGEQHNLRKDGSSGSSYCSVLHSGDRESDLEIDVENRTHLRESSGSYKELRSRNDKQKVKGGVVKEFETHREDKEGHEEVSRQKMASVSSYGEAWNRKKSEKRLAEVSTENSRQEYTDKHFFVSDTQADSKVTSFLEKQHKTTEAKLNLERHTNEETRQQHGRTGTTTVSDSVSSTYRKSESGKISGSYSESNSHYQKQLSGRVQHSGDFNHASQTRDEHIGLILGREGIQKNDGGLKIQEIEGESTVNLQMQSQSKSKYGATLVQSLIQGTREENLQKNQKDVVTYESRKGSEDVSSTSIAHTIDTKTITDNQQAYGKRTNTSGTEFREEAIDRHNQFGRRFIQIKSSNEDQKLARLDNLQEDYAEKSPCEQIRLNFTSDSRVESIHSEEKINISVQPVIMIPPVQLKARWSPDSEPATGSTSEEAKGDLVSPGEQKDEGRRQENLHRPSNVISDSDADVLGSAERLEKSSVHLVGEFVSKARNELSTSEIHKEKQKKKSSHEGEEKIGMGYGSGGTNVNENDSRRPSGVSETKAPSDEMWHVTGTSAKEPPKTNITQQPITTETPVVKRTGRSLWNVIGDVVRLKWISNNKSDSSAAKSGGRSSSNESVSSDAWFSGHEQDQNSDKHVESEQGNSLQGSLSASSLQIEKAPIESQEEGSDIINLKDPIRHGETGSSSSAGTAESVPASQDMYLSPLKQTSSWYTPTSSSQDYTDSGFGALTSLPLVSERLQISPAVSVTGKTEVSGSDSSEQIHKSPRMTLSKVSVPEGNDGELKRRKLQRNKQVPKDRFDEWEDAYKHEMEQRKLDEMFMEEALLEAKKAADIWEVPVGAVLVQRGKVIARGCNLVEELRDSTAHAELICIREASKQLQSWRLEDATLYVTLEPCPMCAGAILQARIDTLVWGAPNKLLGADGSWIRLFPNGSEEGNVSESTDKPPPPVHPFHPKMTIRRGVLASECADVMQQFFQLRRRNKNTKAEKNKTTKAEKPDSSTSPSCIPVTTHPTKLLTKMHGLFNTFC